jgi:hypothetical protein
MRSRSNITVCIYKYFHQIFISEEKSVYLQAKEQEVEQLRKEKYECIQLTLSGRVRSDYFFFCS